MTPPDHSLPTRPLLDDLSGIRVDHGRHRAVIGTAEITADSTAALRPKLAAALYRALHTGQHPVADDDNPSARDHELESALHRQVPHALTHSTALLISRDPAQDIATVDIDGVRVQVAEERLGGDPRPAAFRVSHSAARPRLSPGFFLVQGSQGRPLNGPVLRLYVHFRDHEHAVTGWHGVLGQLERLAVPYQAKVLSHRRHYPRRDSLVVYLGQEAHAALRPLVDTAARLSGRGHDVSRFAKQVGLGVAVAYEPDDPRPTARRLSFGQHRAAAVADALIAHAAPSSTGGLHQAVASALQQAGAHPVLPYLNAGARASDYRLFHDLDVSP
ncbi:T3SS effector HopA1 family protein [Streptomyces sp. NPDC059009]|uniref:T3SS effector HopA1 family protein n=1 Tax=Streptomyces sp. NPDC059009 TaxID=3346694 RepID=UPI00367D5D2B